MALLLVLSHLSDEGTVLDQKFDRSWTIESHRQNLDTRTSITILIFLTLEVLKVALLLLLLLSLQLRPQLRHAMVIDLPR
jgi:hypothetical protein